MSFLFMKVEKMNLKPLKRKNPFTFLNFPHFLKDSRNVLRSVNGCSVKMKLQWLSNLVPPPEFHRGFLDRSPLAAPSPESVSWTGQIPGGLNLTTTVKDPEGGYSKWF